LLIRRSITDVRSRPFQNKVVQRDIHERLWRSKAIGGRSRTALRLRRTSLVSITTRADPGHGCIATFNGNALLPRWQVIPPRANPTPAKKKDAKPNYAKNKSIASRVDTVVNQEVRRIASGSRGSESNPNTSSPWSLWRRAHQRCSSASLKSKRQN